MREARNDYDLPPAFAPLPPEPRVYQSPLAGVNVTAEGDARRLPVPLSCSLRSLRFAVAVVVARNSPLATRYCTEVLHAIRQ